jgi:protein transport protein SEC24
MNKPLSLECVMRTRISSGYKVSSFITPVLISHGDLMRMSTVDENQTYTVILDFQSQSTTPQNKEKDNVNMGGLIQEECEPFIYIQSALLYTHRDGSRRVRIHNLCMPTSKKISEIHESVDCEALSAFYIKILIEKIFKTKKIVNSIISVENMFKTLISSVFSSMHSHTKDLPGNLEYLPLYFCGIVKNRVACKDEIGLKLDIDTSNYFRIKILKMNVNEIINFIYPKFYQIHHLLVDQKLGVVDQEGQIQLPEITSTYAKSLDNDGVYLIDNGVALILYVKLNTEKALIHSLFGVECLTEIKSAISENNLFNEDPLNKRLYNIVEHLRIGKSFFQNILVVFESTDSERL